MQELTRRTLLKLAPAGTLGLLLAACGGEEATPTPVPATPTPFAHSPEFVGRRFLQAWQEGDYDTMYSLLSPGSQGGISREAFETRYRGVLEEATVYDQELALVAAGRLGPREGAAEFDVRYHTRLVGDLNYRVRLNMVLDEGGNWQVAWSPAAIIPALGEENRLRLFPRTSTRGVIYDRNGEILATQGAIVTIGVVPGRIEDEGALQGLIGELSGLAPGAIAERYAGQPPEWFVPIVDIPFERTQDNYDRLVGTPGISLRERAVRAYPQGQTAGHIVGFVGEVSADELAALGERGYEEGDRVGKQGIESWGETLLAGKKGGRLTVLSPDGGEVATLADIPAVQARSLYLTLDLPLQRICEEALGDRNGSMIVADVATGAVLAMAANPRFDPNAMVDDLNSARRQALATDPAQPLVNRATQGVYPSGSLFKIVTMTAAMELANLPRSDPHFCSGVWTDLGFPMACWKTSGHGSIDLYHGLEQSCNVVFFETGIKLYNQDVGALQQMADRFGIGRPTGLEVDEARGVLPTPEWKRDVLNDVWVPGDTVNLSIGQGFLQVTPVQMLRVALTIAAGGSVRSLTLAGRSEDPTGVQPPDYYQPEAPGSLNVRADVMRTVQEAMRAVAVPPWGTASGIFGDYPVAISGKTGTAESVPGRPSHAWFAGYGPSDDPQIAFLGMLEFGGEGSSDAAPMVRQVLDRYFNV